MKTVKLILTLLFGVLMIFGGIYHFIVPEMYFPFIPDFLPEAVVNYAAGIVEILLGVATFIPRLRTLASRGILILMVAFLPLHILDVFSDTPAIGSHHAALVRLPIQVVLILWAWFIAKGPSKK